jgi:hypothetical protein
METIYSRVIWRELGLKDYKIHEEPWNKTEALIIQWLKDTPIERVNEVIKDLSWLESVTFEGYYDGSFHGINQREKENRLKTPNGDPDPDITIHDTAIMTSLIHLFSKIGVSPSELRFIANFMEEYQKKLPKSESCEFSLKEGDEY